MVKILGISGSLREGSSTRKLLDQVLQSCQQKGAVVDTIDLAQYPNLPFCDGRMNNDDSYGPVVSALRKKVQDADALLISTPEYHGGYSGSLKNFLDLNCIENFRDKLVGFLGVAGGRFGAESALNQLRIVFKNLEAFCFKNQTSISPQDMDPTTRQINNPKVLERLETMAQEFTVAAKNVLRFRTELKDLTA